MPGGMPGGMMGGMPGGMPGGGMPGGCMPGMGGPPGGMPQNLPLGIAPPTDLPGASPLDSEELARLRFQQVAAQYDQMKHAGIRPEVAELAEHLGLDDRATRALDEEMKKRASSFESDMQALWVGLEGAQNPSGLMMTKIREMRNGEFHGMSALDTKVQAFAKEMRLDAQAAIKLGEVMHKRPDPETDMMKVGKHLERSNKPSSLMMMLLKKLREGQPIEDPKFAAAVGSVAHEKELKRQMEEKRRSRSRGGGGRRGGGGDRERGGDRGGDRERGSGRDRDRDRGERSRRSRSRRRRSGSRDGGRRRGGGSRSRERR